MATKTLQGKYAEKLEKENEELREELYTTRKVILEEQQQRIDKAIEYIKTTLKFARLEKDFEKEKILLNFLEILGDKENENN